jgi:hypothetical protein
MVTTQNLGFKGFGTGVQSSSPHSNRKLGQVDPTVVHPTPAAPHRQSIALPKGRDPVSKPKDSLQSLTPNVEQIPARHRTNATSATFRPHPVRIAPTQSTAPKVRNIKAKGVSPGNRPPHPKRGTRDRICPPEPSNQFNASPLKNNLETVAGPQKTSPSDPHQTLTRASPMPEASQNLARGHSRDPG